MRSKIWTCTLVLRTNKQIFTRQNLWDPRCTLTSIACCICREMPVPKVAAKEGNHSTACASHSCNICAGRKSVFAPWFPVWRVSCRLRSGLTSRGNLVLVRCGLQVRRKPLLIIKKYLRLNVDCNLNSTPLYPLYLAVLLAFSSPPRNDVLELA